MGLAVAPDGTVASASFDNSVGVWDGGTPIWLEAHNAAVVAVNYDWSLLVTGGDDFQVLMWFDEWLDGQAHPVKLHQHQGKVADIATHPAGGIASAGWDGFVKLSQQPANKDGAVLLGSAFETHALKGHRSNVTSVAFSPVGTLYSASSDGTLRVWEGKGLDLSSRVIVTHGFGINEIVVTQDWIAYGAVDGGTRVITHEGEEIADFTLDRRPILAMAYHAQTHLLAIGDGEGFIMMIDTENWRITRDFRAARRGPVWALAFSPDGQTIYAGGLDDVIYAWPVELLDQFEPGIDGARSFLRKAETMPNGERQFMRKCSICHSLEPGPSRKAGPTLYGVFGRRAGVIDSYTYSEVLDGSDIVWTDATIDALFDLGPDHYIPGSKMPMQVIAKPNDRADLISFLKSATAQE